MWGFSIRQQSNQKISVIVGFIITNGSLNTSSALGQIVIYLVSLVRFLDALLQSFNVISKVLYLLITWTCINDSQVLALVRSSGESIAVSGVHSCCFCLCCGLAHDVLRLPQYPLNTPQGFLSLFTRALSTQRHSQSF